MSTTKKVVLITTCVLVVCLIAAAVIIGTNFGRVGSNGWFGLFSSKSAAIEESASLDLAGIETVNVDCVSGHINITPGEPGAKLTGSILTSSPKEKYLVVSKQGSTLTVKFDADMIFPQTINADVTLSVALPEDSKVNLNVTGASADTELNGFSSLSDVRVDSASGAARVNGCTGNRLKINLTSGLIDVTDAAFKNVDTGCVSGDVNLKNISGSANVSSTSGTVNINSVLGELQVNSTSGNVLLSQPQQDLKAMRVDVTSGNIDLKLNPKAAFNLTADSTSGGIKTDFDVTVSGNVSEDFIGDSLSGKINGGGELLDLYTTSGGIRISKISE